MDRVSYGPPLRQHKNLARLIPLIFNQVRNELRHAHGLIGQTLILDDRDISTAVLISGAKLARLSVSVVSDYRICHRDDSGRTTSALYDLVISRNLMGCRKFTNASRMRKFETVERLIVVTDDAQVRCRSTQQIDDCLFGFVEILIFVDQNMIE